MSKKGLIYFILTIFSFVLLVFLIHFDCKLPDVPLSSVKFNVLLAYDLVTMSCDLVAMTT